MIPVPKILSSQLEMLEKYLASKRPPRHFLFGGWGMGGSIPKQREMKALDTDAIGNFKKALLITIAIILYLALFINTQKMI